jgi:hypothetical protein
VRAALRLSLVDVLGCGRVAVGLRSVERLGCERVTRLLLSRVVAEGLLREDLLLRAVETSRLVLLLLLPRLADVARFVRLEDRVRAELTFLFFLLSVFFAAALRLRDRLDCSAPLTIGTALSSTSRTPATAKNLVNLLTETTSFPSRPAPEVFLMPLMRLSRCLSPTTVYY